MNNRRMVRVPLDRAAAMTVYDILSLLGFDVEIEEDYATQEMVIRCYEREGNYVEVDWLDGNHRYGQINLAGEERYNNVE